MAEELDPVTQVFDADLGPYVEGMRRGEEEAKKFAVDNKLTEDTVHGLVRALEENSAALDTLAFELQLASKEESKLRDHSMETGAALGHLRDQSLETAAAEAALGHESRKAAESIDLMGLSGAGTATKFAPMMAGLAGLIGLAISVAPAFAAAGLGLGAFALFAIPTIMQIKNGYTAVATAQKAYTSATTSAARTAALAKEKQAWQQMGQPIAQVVREIQAFKSEFSALAKSSGFQSAALQDIGQIFHLMRELLPVVIPLARQGAIALHQLLSAMGAGVQSTGFAVFMQTMTKLVVPAMAAIRNLAGALLGLLGHALVALAPLAVPLLNMLAGLVRSLSGPLISLLGLFQSLLFTLLRAIQPIIPVLARVGTVILTAVVGAFQQLIPIVGQVANTLLPALAQILLSLAPVIATFLTPNSPFMVALGMVPGLLRAIMPLFTALASLLSHSIFATLIVDIVSLIVAGKGLISLLGLVSKAFGLLGLAFEATPIGWIITGVAAIVFAFVELWKHCAGFRDFWKGLWHDIQNLMAPVVDWIHNVIENMTRWWHDHGQQVMRILKEAWTVISTIITVQLKLISGFIKSELSVIEGIFRAVWAIIQIATRTAFTVIYNIVYTIIHSVYDIISFVLNVIEGHWGAAWNNLRDLASTGMHGIINVIKAVSSGFISILWQAGRDLIQGLINGIGSMAGAVWNTITSIGSKVGGFFKSVLHIGSPSRVFYDHGVNILLGLVQGMLAAAPSAYSTITGIARTIGTMRPTVPASAYGAYTATGGAVPAAYPAAGGAGGTIQVMVDGVKLFEILQRQLYQYNVRNSGSVTGSWVPGSLT